MGRLTAACQNNPFADRVYDVLIMEAADFLLIYKILVKDNKRDASLGSLIRK